MQAFFRAQRPLIVVKGSATVKRVTTMFLPFGREPVDLYPLGQAHPRIGFAKLKAL